jgi:hypothetical protein
MWLSRNQLNNIQKDLYERCEITTIAELLEFDDKSIQFVVDGCDMKALTKMRFLKAFEQLRAGSSVQANF